MKKLIHGVGINDSDYAVCPTINGKRVWCPFYVTWVGMLKRCYCPKWQAKKPTYIGCLVVPEWHSFMAFRAWMIEQDYEGKHLDKDLLIPGNKIYGPDTCVFVDSQTNTLLIDRAAARGEWPIGVDKSRNRYRANIRRDGKLVFLGYYDTPELAHAAYCGAKAVIVWEAAQRQPDGRVKHALRVLSLALRRVHDEGTITFDA